MNVDGFRQKIEKLRLQIQRLLQCDGTKPNSEDLLRDADTAMYQAKMLVRARYELFNSDMYANVLAKLQLDAQLRRAIEREEFRVYYQPIVSLTIGHCPRYRRYQRSPNLNKQCLFPLSLLFNACQLSLNWKKVNLRKF